MTSGGGARRKRGRAVVRHKLLFAQEHKSLCVSARCMCVSVYVSVEAEENKVEGAGWRRKTIMERGGGGKRFGVAPMFAQDVCVQGGVRRGRPLGFRANRAPFSQSSEEKNKNEKQQNQRALPAQTFSPVCKSQTLQNRRQHRPDVKSADGLWGDETKIEAHTAMQEL